jgi:hypothetical protein
MVGAAYGQKIVGVVSKERKTDTEPVDKTDSF